MATGNRFHSGSKQLEQLLCPAEDAVFGPSLLLRTCLLLCRLLRLSTLNSYPKRESRICRVKMPPAECAAAPMHGLQSRPGMELEVPAYVMRALKSLPDLHHSTPDYASQTSDVAGSDRTSGAVSEVSTSFSGACSSRLQHFGSALHMFV